MTDEEPQLDAAQERAVTRIQVIGVFLLIVLTITLRVLGNTGVISVWAVVTIGPSALLALVVGGGFAVSRVERTTFMDVMRRTHRAAWKDLRSQPARIRQRVSAALHRDRRR